jgi:hypothetical protein
MLNLDTHVLLYALSGRLEIIAATSVVHGVPLVTRDTMLRARPSSRSKSAPGAAKPKARTSASPGPRSMTTGTLQAFATSRCSSFLVVIWKGETW